jgi:hypothetical protein
MNKPDEHDLLFSRVCDGLATAEEIAVLHRLLHTDAAGLDAWLRYSALHGELASGSALASGADRTAAFAVLPSPPKQAAMSADRRGFRMQWRPLMAAAAGLVFGLFTATMVWAYVSPLAGKGITLLEENFETSSVPLVPRTALEPGIWRGDNAEIVGAEQGVKPAGDAKMLRFLRADYDGKAKPAGSHIADVYRLIDVRPYRHDFADGGAVAQMSASFNATSFPPDEKYGCAISIYALDAETVPDKAGRVGTALTADAIAMARSSRTKLDHDPSTWQRLTTELRLPANAEFLVVRLHITQSFDSVGNPTFTGSYADDVQVSLTRRSPLP